GACRRTARPCQGDPAPVDQRVARHRAGTRSFFSALGRDGRAARAPHTPPHANRRFAWGPRAARWDTHLATLAHAAAPLRRSSWRTAAISRYARAPAEFGACSRIDTPRPGASAKRTVFGIG